VETLPRINIRGKRDVCWSWDDNPSFSLFVYKAVGSGHADEVTNFIHAFKGSKDYECFKTAMVEFTKQLASTSRNGSENMTAATSFLSPAVEPVKYRLTLKTCASLSPRPSIWSIARRFSANGPSLLPTWLPMGAA
jgi:hypothetical protein